MSTLSEKDKAYLRAIRLESDKIFSRKDFADIRMQAVAVQLEGTNIPESRQEEIVTETENTHLNDASISGLGKKADDIIKGIVRKDCPDGIISDQRWQDSAHKGAIQKTKIRPRGEQTKRGGVRAKSYAKSVAMVETMLSEAKKYGRENATMNHAAKLLAEYKDEKTSNRRRKKISRVLYRIALDFSTRNPLEIEQKSTEQCKCTECADCKHRQLLRESGYGK